MSYLPRWMESAPEHEVSPEAIHAVSRHAFRQELAKATANKFDDLTNRVAAYRMFLDSVKDEPENPAFVPGVQNRPELRAMGRWAPPDYSSPDHRSAFDLARDQAQH